MAPELQAPPSENEVFAIAFREALSMMLVEIFEHVNGFILDEGTSMFETLATVSAEEASKPISSPCAPIAAQVNHTRYYIDVLLEMVATGQPPETDWDGSWQVGPVNDDEWQALIHGLRSSYRQLQELTHAFDRWDTRSIGGAFAVVGHCAYHLGEIRQGLGVLRG